MYVFKKHDLTITTFWLKKKKKWLFQKISLFLWVFDTFLENFNSITLDQHIVILNWVKKQFQNIKRNVGRVSRFGTTPTLACVPYSKCILGTRSQNSIALKVTCWIANNVAINVWTCESEAQSNIFTGTGSLKEN